MKRNILLKIILITVTIGVLLAVAAVVKKNADDKIKVSEKNSAAVETIQTKKATESNLAELKVGYPTMCEYGGVYKIIYT